MRKVRPKKAHHISQMFARHQEVLLDCAGHHSEMVLLGSQGKEP